MEINSKICTKCNKDKLFSEFNKAKYGKYGLRSICRECQAAEAIEYQKKAKEKIAAYGRMYREREKEKISIRRAFQTLKNKGRFTEYRKQWAKDNPGKVNAKTARRRASKRMATPKWLTEDHWAQIEIFYVESAIKKEETGIPHEVDHIIPLQGKNICGLHVPWNLKVITRSENRKKSRKLIV